MIAYRCTACTHDHATLTANTGMNEEPKCERCGLSSFCLIHLPDPDAAPPTPRDLPLPVEGESLPEPRDVAALRGIEGKPAGVCGQYNCEEPATHRFTWPGHPEAVVCHRHAKKAIGVADAMGFFLEVPALQTTEPWPA